MGLDVVMIGLNEIKESVKTDPYMATMVKWLQENIPETQTTDIGEPSGPMSGGHRLGLYSDLHVLRGLALLYEREGADAARASTEDELYSESDRFYEADPPLPTRFAQLVNHSDSDGVYVPLPVPQPVFVNGTVRIPGQDDEDVSVSIGSSTALLAELDELAPLIGLPGDQGAMSDTEFDQAVSAHKWPTVAYVWGLLHWYARESVRGRTLIQFC
jgi:hypothetical protein